MCECEEREGEACKIRARSDLIVEGYGGTSVESTRAGWPTATARRNGWQWRSGGERPWFRDGQGGMNIH